MRNAKLYSGTFAFPDPDGQMRRYWANYQWNENLFHRRDQWGRESHLPAEGVPPVTRRRAGPPPPFQGCSNAMASCRI